MRRINLLAAPAQSRISNVILIADAKSAIVQQQSKRDISIWAVRVSASCCLLLVPPPMATDHCAPQWIMHNGHGTRTPTRVWIFFSEVITTNGGTRMLTTAITITIFLFGSRLTLLLLLLFSIVRGAIRLQTHVSYKRRSQTFRRKKKSTTTANTWLYSVYKYSHVKYARRMYRNFSFLSLRLGEQIRKVEMRWCVRSPTL